MQPLLPMLDNLSTQWKTWKEQFGSYLIATGLDKAPKEKQLAIFQQRFGTDRPCILPSHTGNNLKKNSYSLLKKMFINLPHHELQKKRKKNHYQYPNNNDQKVPIGQWCAHSCSFTKQTSVLSVVGQPFMRQTWLQVTAAQACTGQLACHLRVEFEIAEELW